MKKERLMPVLVLTLFLLMPVSAYGIGISPSRVEIDFQPNYEDIGYFTVLNNEDRTIDIVMYVSGDLAEYVKISESSVTLPPQSSETFSFTVSLPDSLDRPGRHDTRIGALEAAPGEGMVAARAGVEMQFWVNVPYPGKYLEWRFSAASVKKGESVTFTTEATSLGEEDIESARVTVDIYDSKGDLVDTVNSAEKSIAKDGGETFIILWPTTNIDVGRYNATATLSYDGEKETREGHEFNIGELRMDIINITPKELETGTINQVMIEVENIWAERIDDVYADIDLAGAISKTESISFSPFERKNIIGYVDTTGLSAGEHNIKITLHYGENETEKTFKVTIRGAEISASVFYITGFVIFIFLIAIWLYRKKERNKKYRRSVVQ